MERVAAVRTDHQVAPETAAGSWPGLGEAVVTAAAGMGIVCAVAAAAGAWMLMTDPDRLMWAATVLSSAARVLAGG